MSRATRTRTVNGLAPVVQRALDPVDAHEALANPGSSDREPRSDGGRTRWNAARLAADRVD